MEHKLDTILTDLITLKTDMQYVKKHITDTTQIPTRLAITENKVNTLVRITWGIGSVLGSSILVALLAIIL